VNKPFLSRWGPPTVAALFFSSALGLSGCGENIFEVKWTEARVDTALIYSLARPELNLASGFDFVRRLPIEIQSAGATGSWDLLLDTQDGELLFLLPAALDIPSEALVLPMPGMAFDDVLKAPKDTTLYTRDGPVPVVTGTVYVVRTHKSPDRFGIACVFYGKFQPLVVDPAQGTVRFTYDVNTICDNRALIPEG
jgi:hypothetical protein